MLNIVKRGAAAVGLTVLSLALSMPWHGAPAQAGAPATAPGERRAAPHRDDPDDDAHGGMAGHVHATVPDAYRSAHVPASVWTDPQMIARGRAIYQARCAVCHGERGDGMGPAGVALPLKPPDLRDPSMINVMRGNYWFWRVSEGGQVEPFKSQGSVMPVWKEVLSIEDRWAVIAYQHTFSGHEGPHVISEHPEMVLSDAAPQAAISDGHDRGEPAPPAGGHTH
jgi:mono/diheme cytochrome c family protein